MFALLYSATHVLTPSRSSTVCRRRSRRLKRVEQEQRGHMRCRRRRWRRDPRFRRGHVPTPMVARSVCASRGGTLDSYELVTSGVALHWAFACETRRRTCSGRRCSSGRLVRRHEPSGRVRPRGPGKRGHRGHTMRAHPRGFGLCSPRGANHRPSSRFACTTQELALGQSSLSVRSLRVGEAGRASTQSYFIFRAQGITRTII